MASNATAAENRNGFDLMRKFRAVSIDIWFMLLLIAGFNLHLLGLPVGQIAVFLPSAVADGQWWRIISHPFVHVSWYHLLLDAGAFFLLYSSLSAARIHERLLIFSLCAGASLLTAVWFADQIEVIGLCGLSGAAHGLMAITGLDMIRPRDTQKRQVAIGLVSFLAVGLKSIFEALNGEVLFDFMHMGLCGTPLAACHLGGVIGGIAAYLLLGHLKKRS